MLLREMGHEVHIAMNGALVAGEAKRLRPDVIFLDIGLPGLDGWQAARLVRAQSGFETVRIVAITGYATDEDRQRSRQAGFDAHIVKPIDFKLLESILRHV